MRRLLIVVCAVAAFAPIGGSAAAADPSPPADCTWGASSTVADLENGEIVASDPVTSGCIPR